MTPKVYVGVCMARYEMSAWCGTRHAIEDSLSKAGVWGGGFEATGARIDWNSNTIVKGFLQTNGTHLLMIETDCKIPAQAPLQLLGFNKDIVGALLFNRTEYYPIMLKFRAVEQNEWGHDVEMYDSMSDVVYDFLRAHNIPLADDSFLIEGQDGLMECDTVAMGCTLIKRQVFEQMPGPWFTYSESYYQDIEFCRYAQRQGFKVFCDMGIICGHYNEVPIGQGQFRLLYERGLFKVQPHFEAFVH